LRDAPARYLKKGAMLAFDWGSPEDQNIPLVFKKECDSC
jgi:hypothetical protein